MPTFTNRIGMKFAADEAGAAHAPLVVLLHGGGQTRHSWRSALHALAESGFRAISLDLRGHGDSDWAPDGRYDVPAMSEDLVDVLAQLPSKPALVGASAGGLTALSTVGCSNTPVATALVMVDVVPQMEVEGMEEIRTFMSANRQGFDTLEAAADAVATYLPNRARRSDPRGLLKNLRVRAGRYYWHWDPALLGTFDNANFGELRRNLEQAARRVQIPTLLIRGGLSRIVSVDGVSAFRQLIPHSEFVNVERADHMVAGDANDDFNEPLLAFLRRTVMGAGVSICAPSIGQSS